MSRFKVLDIEISIVTMEKVICCIIDWSNDKIGRYICVRDVPSLMLAITDRRLKVIYQNAAIITPDGMPLVWLGRGLGHNLERVCGPDLMYNVCIQQKGLGLNHFFYGGKPGVAQVLKNRLQNECNELNVVGVFCPPFRELSVREEENVVQMILDSKADVIWLGISSPKQDIWMANHASLLPQTMIGVGAAFDFLSGEVSRAPRWMQNSGLEWIYRFFSEPRRLWRRYLIQVPKFIYMMIKNNQIFFLFKGLIVSLFKIKNN